ncbi:MAG: hypothetical protein AAGC95_17750 [Pseudomonadota bacterium]
MTTNTHSQPGPNHTGLQGEPAGLLRSTLLSLGAAILILIAVVLPAEYNIDPLKIGGLLGLTEMGGIKQQLSVEAAADGAAQTDETTGDIIMRLDAIQAQLQDLSSALNTNAADAGDAAKAPTPAEPVWRDEVSFVLKPGEGIELKLIMDKGAVAEFEWTANGGALNYDTHGDGSGQNISYERGRGSPGQKDTLTAAFTGKHGWFFRNRMDENVTLTLRVRGAYVELIRTA